jgi:hypothetical protein
MSKGRLGVSYVGADFTTARLRCERYSIPQLPAVLAWGMSADVARLGSLKGWSQNDKAV